MWVREQLVRREDLIVPDLDSDGSRRRPRGFLQPLAPPDRPLCLPVLPASDAARGGIDLSGAKVGFKIKSAVIPASSETHLR